VEIAGENENEQRTAEEILLSAIDGIRNDKLTGFALRLALTGHVAILREGEFDFLAEAETAFAPPQPKNAVSKKPKVKTPIRSKRLPNPHRRRPQRRRKLQANLQREPDKRLPLFSKRRRRCFSSTTNSRFLSG
jgi:hypothetical protein